jgi:hypothetical protein
LQHPRLLAGNYTGHAHVEKNWGGSFPSKWLWAQGISESFDFAFAGGDLGINDRLPNAYLLRWRGRNTQFEYGPLDNLVSPLRVDGNYCPRLGGSVVTVRGQLPLQAIAFEITVEAEMV